MRAQSLSMFRLSKMQFWIPIGSSHCSAQALNIQLKSNKVKAGHRGKSSVCCWWGHRWGWHAFEQEWTEEEKTASRQRAGDMTAVKYSYWRLRRQKTPAPLRTALTTLAYAAEEVWRTTRWKPVETDRMTSRERRRREESEFRSKHSV